MATGVLILGVGGGTKSLNRFLECTKSYEAVVLFGAATDSYDSVGRIVGRKAYGQVTRDMVEEALGKFRGKIMQRPPIYSALRVQGKRLYEYAREGKEVPVEIQERPVEVQSLEMLEWMDSGTHIYHWPEEEVEREEKEVVEKVLHLGADASADVSTAPPDGDQDSGVKRKRQEETANGALDPKRPKPSPKPKPRSATQDKPSSPQPPPGQPNIPPPPRQQQQPCPAPACRLRMTVTSGFYVRSLCHDLGEAVGSLGLMAGLVRTRQGDFELGKNVLEYDDLAEGEDVWGAKVKGMLVEWTEKEGEGGK